MRSINEPVTRREWDDAHAQVLKASAEAREAHEALIVAERAEREARSHLSRIRRAASVAGWKPGESRP